MNIDTNLVQALRDGLYFCLCGGLGLSAIWGFWLLLHPEKTQKFTAAADRWVPTQGAFERLNRPIKTSRWVYRHHRAVGALIFLGAGYGLMRWGIAFDSNAVLDMMDPKVRSMGLDWIVDAIGWIFVTFNALFLMLGLIVFVRPSLLRAPERWADRWVAVPADQTMDRRFDPLKGALERRPRLTGGIVTAACSFLLFLLLNT